MPTALSENAENLWFAGDFVSWFESVVHHCLGTSVLGRLAFISRHGDEEWSSLSASYARTW